MLLGAVRIFCSNFDFSNQFADASDAFGRVFEDTFGYIVFDIWLTLEVVPKTVDQEHWTVAR